MSVMLVAWVAVLLLLVLGLGWARSRWLSVSGHWAARGVPHLPPHPVLGSLTFFFKEHMTTWLRHIYDSFKSPYVGIWLFWRPGVVINSPELAKRILVTDFNVFRDRAQNTTNASDKIGSLQLFTVKDPLWSSIRRYLTPAFTPHKLKMLQKITYLKANELVQRIQNEINNGTILNLRSLYTDYSTDIISIASLGVNSGATLTGESPFRDITREMEKFNWHRFLSWCSIFFLPELTGIFRFLFYPKSATDYFRKIVQSVEKQRASKQRKGQEDKDLFEILMKMKQDYVENGYGNGEDLLIAQAMAFLQGAFDTSSLILTFATYELAFNPSVQNKLYEELKDARRNSGSNEFEIKNLTDLPYLNATLNETLRKYTTLGFIERMTLKPYKIDENFTIPKGTPVYINAIGMHYDPEFYPEPESFRPERFINENEEMTPFTFLPFGEGPRQCIGIRFAYQKMQYALAVIVLNFKIMPLPGSLKPKDIELDTTNLFLAPKNNLSVRLVPRFNDDTIK